MSNTLTNVVAVAPAQKSEVLNGAIRATDGVAHRLRELVARLRGEEQPQIPETAKPSESSILDVLNFGPERLEGFCNEAHEALNNIEQILF